MCYISVHECIYMARTCIVCVSHLRFLHSIPWEREREGGEREERERGEREREREREERERERAIINLPSHCCFAYGCTCHRKSSVVALLPLKCYLCIPSFSFCVSLCLFSLYSSYPVPNLVTTQTYRHCRGSTKEHWRSCSFGKGWLFSCARP